MLSRFLVIAALLLLEVMSSSTICAQNFDPNCYFPTIGITGEIDSIYGGFDQQFLSSGINLGRNLEDPQGRVAFYGRPDNAAKISIARTGSGFSLHNLDIIARTNLGLGYGEYQIAHLHSPKIWDIVRTSPDYGFPRIFWGDAKGNFDTSIYTDLSPTHRDTGFVGYGNVQNCFIANLSQDSVDDIVFGVFRGIVDRLDLDSDYVVYFKGGDTLFNTGKSARPDDERVLLHRSDLTHVYGSRHISQGRWRGRSREDLIASDPSGNLFFYPNDPNFTLSRYVHALIFDTLWSASENPGANTAHPKGQWNFNPPAAYLPRPASDSSVDFIPTMIYPSPSVQEDLLMYRGGATFGVHRLKLDDAEFRLALPKYFSYYANCGDMTGTGNRVLMIVGGSDDKYYQQYNFYVMGHSIDDLVDMSYSCTQWAQPSASDTLDADGDGLTDLMWSNPGFVSATDNDKGWSSVGTIQVVHGSKRIPVRSRAVPIERRAADELNVFPNPMRSSGTVTFPLQFKGEVSILVRDVLGRIVHRISYTAFSDNREFALDLQSLPSGTYRLEVVSRAIRLFKEVMLVR
jgi:hypothetical protein